METLHILLGAILALGSGVITHHIQSYYAQLKEEGAILFSIEKSLLEIGGIESQLEQITDDTSNPKTLARKHSLTHQRITHLENLHLLAIRITSNTNLHTAVRVTKFALDEHLRTENNRNELLNEVQEALNSKLLKQYTQEMKSDPNTL